MEEACASGEGVGVSATGAALPEGIPAPSPLGKATVGTFSLSDPNLEKRHQEHLLIPDISDIVEEHASKHFNPYISYCSNEVYQQRTLDKLL
ncbi:hypothetical protein Nmel_015809 [Mimus melanotis]